MILLIYSIGVLLAFFMIRHYNKTRHFSAKGISGLEGIPLSLLSWICLAGILVAKILMFIEARRNKIEKIWNAILDFLDKLFKNK